MKMNQPLVSVIIPTCQRDALLTRALRSVLNQSFADLECIVVDDDPSESTQTLVRDAGDNRATYLANSGQHGASAARNMGIDRARGEFIAFLDDDDEWLPEKLEKQVGLIQSLPERFGMVYCWMDYFNQEGVLVHEHHPTLKGDVFAELLPGQAIGGCPTLLIRRAVAEHVGEFDVSLVRGNDGDFIRRVCRHYEVDYVPEVLVRVHVGHGYGRISDLDAAGRVNAIRSEKVKLEKFADVLSQYPRQTSIILAKIGAHYAALGEWGQAAAYFRRSLRWAPISTPVYRYMAKSALSALRGLTRGGGADG